MADKLNAQKRLNKEFSEITVNPPPGVSASLVDDNDLFIWSAIICGPENTPYEGGLFEIELIFTPLYPNKAPQAKFLCDMFHPNIYASGAVCIDMLEEEDKWKPTFTASTILYAIQAMLSDPNPNSPANSEANDLFLNDTAEFWRRVQETLPDF